MTSALSCAARWNFSTTRSRRRRSPILRQRAIEGFNALQALESHGPLDLSDATDPQLSFRLARPVSDLTFRQILLSTRSEAERLKQIADFLPNFLVKQRRIQHIKQVAPRNGHGQGLAGIE